MSIAGSSLTEITTGNDLWPHWSNDGKLIVFTKDVNGDPYREEQRIFIVNPSRPLEENQISSLESEQPDIFIISKPIWR